MVRAAGFRIRAGKNRLAVAPTIRGGFSSKRYRKGTRLVTVPRKRLDLVYCNERQNVGAQTKPSILSAELRALGTSMTLAPGTEGSSAGGGSVCVASAARMTHTRIGRLGRFFLGQTTGPAAWRQPSYPAATYPRGTMILISPASCRSVYRTCRFNSCQE